METNQLGRWGIELPNKGPSRAAIDLLKGALEVAAALDFSSTLFMTGFAMISAGELLGNPAGVAAGIAVSILGLGAFAATIVLIYQVSLGIVIDLLE